MIDIFMCSVNLWVHDKKSRAHYMPKDFEIQYGFSTYIHKVLKLIHPGHAVQSTATNAINQMSHHFIEKILDQAELLRRGKSTLDITKVLNAVKIVLPGELGAHAMAEIEKAVTKHAGTDTGTKANPVSVTSRAGLTVPPSLLGRIVREKTSYNRVGNAATIALAAATEYILAEILELSGNVTTDMGKKQISEAHVMKAITNDEELSALFTGVLNGGVLPHIHSVLLPRKNNEWY